MMNNYLKSKNFLLKAYANNKEKDDKLDDKKIYPNEIEKKDKLEAIIKDEINKEFFVLLQKNVFDENDALAVKEFIKKYIKDNKYFFQQSSDHDFFVKSIVDEIFGLGLLEQYINDDNVQEIWISGTKYIYIDENGVRKKADINFKNDNIIVSMINKILAPVNRKVDESNPLVDARLRDGSRVAITMPPVALNGPEITIRKFKKEKFTIWDYVKYDSMSQKMADFLSNAVAAGLNILVVGGTSSGKTTLLNALSNEIPQDRSAEHVITIEDSAELMIYAPFWQAWETKNANSEGKGGINSSDLVKHSLRNSPDRIIVGEIRDKVAYEVLQASITGHKGCMATIHADNASKAVERFSTLAGSAGVIEATDAKDLFCGAFDLIVVVERLTDPNTNKPCRKVTQICHIVGIGPQAGKILASDGWVKEPPKDDLEKQKQFNDPTKEWLQDIFKLNKKTFKFESTGYVPQELVKKAEAEVRPFDLEIFTATNPKKNNSKKKKDKDKELKEELLKEKEQREKQSSQE